VLKHKQHITQVATAFDNDVGNIVEVGIPSIYIVSIPIYMDISIGIGISIAVWSSRGSRHCWKCYQQQGQ
jgi:hypothetical protein